MRDLKQFIKTTIREYLNENIEFLLDKESDEYNHKDTELDNTDKKLHISDVINSNYGFD